MNEKNLAAAWEAFFEGNLDQAQALESRLTEETFSRLNLQAYLALEKGDYSRARDILMNFLYKAQREQNLAEEHVAYHQLAYVARSEGDWDEAMSWIEVEALFLEQHFPEDHYRQSVNLYERGYLYLKDGQLDLAEQYLRQGFHYALESDDLINQACAYRGLGELYLAQGRPEAAKDEWHIAALLFEKAGDELGKAEVEALLSSSF